jgi:hypothetical protein
MKVVDEARRERWALAPVELFDPAVPGAFQTREPKIDREISDANRLSRSRKIPKK